MRNIALGILFLAVSAGVHAMERSFKLTVRNVVPDSGRVYVALYGSEAAYRKGEHHYGLVLEASGTSLSRMVTVPEGHYVISVFQDANGNGKLDLNFFGIPREPFGISNYNGNGIPGGFDRLKTGILEDGREVEICLRRLL